MPRINRTTANQHRAINAYERNPFPEFPQGADGETEPDPAAVVAEARERAEEKVREAYAEGFRRGQEAGEAQFQEQVAEAAQMLKAASDALVAARTEFLQSLEPQVLDLVRVLVERVLEREAQTDPELIQTTVRSALDRLADQERITLRVNPADLQAVREQRVTLLDEFDAVAQLEIVSDENVAAGGCFAETARLQVDAQLRAQAEELIEHMLG